MLFFRRAMKDDLTLPVSQLGKGDIRAYPHLAAHIRHQRPHQGIPRRNRPFIDCQGFVRYQGILINRAHHSGAAAGAAGPLAVKGQLLCRKTEKPLPAFRADKLLSCRHCQRRFQIVSIRAAMAGKPGIHQTQAVQKFRSRSEGTADTGYAGTLMQCQRRRYIKYLIHLRPGRLCHTSAGIS